MKIIIKKTIDEPTNTDAICNTILCERGITDKEQFIHPPHPDTILFSDVFSKQVIKKSLVPFLERLSTLHNSKEMIIVYTDYDADGISGGAIMWETLHLLGFHVMPYVPDRKEEGYGFSEKGIDKVKQLYDPSLIISVDHGIMGHKGIAYAKKKHIPVVVTDHHQALGENPEAVAIFHTKELSGSGVAYFIAREIYKNFKQLDDKTIEQLKNNFSYDYLAFSAIGSVADLVPLIGINRSIVKHGLEALQKTNREGLVELINEAGLKKEHISTFHIGYVIAPRLNAFGRLSKAVFALRLLCTRNINKAKELALSATRTNKERQTLVEDILKKAHRKINSSKKIIIIKSSSWNEGVIGLIASKIVEHYTRPAIVFTKVDGFYKGSARSVPSIHILDFLKQFKSMFIELGGHAQACGMSVDREQIITFAEVVEKKAEQLFTDEDIEKQIEVDVYMPLKYATLTLAKKLQQLEPFGIGCTQPVFSSDGIVEGVRLFGSDRRHTVLALSEKAHVKEIKYFNNTDISKTCMRGKKVRVIYKLSCNVWRQKEELLLSGIHLLSEF